MTIFACPHCRNNFKVEAQHQGQIVACPICTQHVHTPTNATPIARPTAGTISDGGRSLDDYEDEGVFQHVFANLAGINHSNADGIRRQDILAKCRQGEHITLVLDDANEYSKTAVQARRGNGEIIGYLPDKNENDWATYVRDEISMGELFDAYAYNLEQKGTEVFTRLAPGTSLITMEILLIQFDKDEVSDAPGYVESVLREYELTPLHRPSNDITERTKIHRIGDASTQSPMTRRPLGRYERKRRARDRRRKEDFKIYFQLLAFIALIGIPLTLFIFCSSILREN